MVMMKRILFWCVKYIPLHLSLLLLLLNHEVKAHLLTEVQWLTEGQDLLQVIPEFSIIIYK